MVDITNIDSKIASISDKYKYVLDYLKDAEGNVVERNPGESDITAPLGVYRKEHPNADVFVYIDSVAKAVTSDPSTAWSASTIAKVDSLVDKKVCYYLAYLYYSDFYKSAALDYYDAEVAIAIVSIYANSPLLCNTSVQKAVNTMGVKNYIHLDNGPLKVDGGVGSGTKSELTEIDGLSKDVNYSFRLLILHHVKTGYLTLYLGNIDKFCTFIKGWFNRVDNLLAL